MQSASLNNWRSFFVYHKKSFQKILPSGLNHCALLSIRKRAIKIHFHSSCRRCQDKTTSLSKKKKTEDSLTGLLAFSIFPFFWPCSTSIPSLERGKVLQVYYNYKLYISCAYKPNHPPIQHLFAYGCAKLSAVENLIL